MNIYAEPGHSFQQVGGDCPDGWVVMHSERPTPDHVADSKGAWVDAKEPTPASVSRYQGREAMRLTPHGEGGASLFDAFMVLMEREETPVYYRRAWDELQAFERTSPMLNAAADELGLTQAQRDDLFRLAATLRA
ncbi:hypothetical protein [Achromobacter kerstersii]|jgi:hypothetical protein